MFTGPRRLGLTSIRRVALAQAGVALTGALLGSVLMGVDAGVAVLYGALTAAAVSGVLAWRENQARRHPEWDQHRLFKLFIRVAGERLIVLAGLLSVGLGVLKLAPLPLLLGLVAAQFAWLAAASGGKRS